MCGWYPCKGRKWHGLYLPSGMQEVVPDIVYRITVGFASIVIVCMVDNGYLCQQTIMIQIMGNARWIEAPYAEACHEGNDQGERNSTSV